MNKKDSYIIAAITLLAFGFLWGKGFWFTEVYRTHKSNEPHRTALLRIQGAIAIGDPHASVFATYWQNRTESLRLIADRPTGWIITTPLELGASNLKLLIEFQGGNVVAVRLRTADGPPPKDGPEDKQKSAGQPMRSDEPMAPKAHRRF
ncbi:MAG: hypothetical protein ACO1QB_11990 [Verrucomicrobiales bacterium]